ncbi:protein translocase subunit SecD [Rhizomicrobium electricum]|jgi:protein-export membrane protein SecD|uniref:Protein translocase subunit SecD n=1 Tax=Rhizomicrobium electricum TaxID=480070 RepID=A0ABN1EBM6_9PROT|nr:protein translocase subunit SecD [Rhizomicrobium electricum]NIJ48166.1 protein-export membrane protein SecD [Rhizomicrobium electricum]
MLQVSAWVRIVVGLVLIFGIAIALPNALPENVRNSLPSWMPKNTASLGLDLQGGSYVLLEVQLDQVMKDQLDSTVGDIRRALRKQHIAYEFKRPEGSIGVRILNAADYPNALKAIKDLNPAVTGAALIGTKQYDISETGDNTAVLKMSEAYKKQLKKDVVGRSIEVVRKRVDELGTKEPSIEQQGEDRIVVQVPGLADPKHLIELLKTTAKMTFQMVDTTNDTMAAITQHRIPPNSELLEMATEKGSQRQLPILVEKRVLIAGDRLKDAGYSTNQQTGGVVVTFRFDSVGAKEFAEITKENVGKPFAIVLDKKVLTAPVIREPIIGGSGQIEGSYSIQTANDLAVLLRAGALPAPLNPIDQRTVGPELGKDSIESGKIATIAGLGLVAIFMILRYGLFGLFADIAMGTNLILLMAAMTLFGATLTLPGIAGIVLTLGMAVDANVLIFERMREEHRNGRSMLGSVDTGERRAIATIIDANMTHLIAALILFELGSGPVRGFAVTLGVGILTSFFTSVVVARLIIIAYLNFRKPKKLII